MSLSQAIFHYQSFFRKVPAAGAEKSRELSIFGLLHRGGFDMIT
jgi:hypothetical protein